MQGASRSSPRRAHAAGRPAPGGLLDGVRAVLATAEDAPPDQAPLAAATERPSRRGLGALSWGRCSLTLPPDPGGGRGDAGARRERALRPWAGLRCSCSTGPLSIGTADGDQAPLACMQASWDVTRAVAQRGDARPRRRPRRRGSPRRRARASTPRRRGPAWRTWRGRCRSSGRGSRRAPSALAPARATCRRGDGRAGLLCWASPACFYFSGCLLDLRGRLTGGGGTPWGVRPTRSSFPFSVRGGREREGGWGRWRSSRRLTKALRSRRDPLRRGDRGRLGSGARMRHQLQRSRRQPGPKLATGKAAELPTSAQNVCIPSVGPRHGRDPLPVQSGSAPGESRIAAVDRTRRAADDPGGCDARLPGRQLLRRLRARRQDRNGRQLGWCSAAKPSSGVSTSSANRSNSTASARLASGTLAGDGQFGFGVPFVNEGGDVEPAGAGTVGITSSSCGATRRPRAGRFSLDVAGPEEIDRLESGLRKSVQTFAGTVDILADRPVHVRASAKSGRSGKPQLGRASKTRLRLLTGSTAPGRARSQNCSKAEGPLLRLSCACSVKKGPAAGGTSVTIYGHELHACEHGPVSGPTPAASGRR